MKPLSEQIAAAEMFVRIARFHRDDPRPERLEQARQELLDAVGDDSETLDRRRLRRKIGAALILCLGFIGFASNVQAVIGWLHA